MGRVYRRSKAEPLRWHFDTRCPNWPGPESDFAQSLDVPPNDPVCGDCERLEAQLFRKTHETARSLH